MKLETKSTGSMTCNSIKIGLAQINFTVGDLEGNYQKIASYYQKSQDSLDLLVFSELAICGYFPEDLLFKDYFIRACEEKIADLANLTKDSKCAILLGAPYQLTNKNGQKSLYNAAFLLENGEISEIICKNILPNYGVFDEKRYFKPDISLKCFDFKGFNLTVLICEDIWHVKNAYLLSNRNLDAIIAINASPYYKNKSQKRLEAVQKFNQELQKPLIYVNQIGLQDSILFDGGSFVMDHDGKLKFSLAPFNEELGITELVKNENEVIIKNPENREIIQAQDEEMLYEACVLAVRDYITKNSFKKVLIGMSGGIDSALVAAIAVDALGNENVKLVALPTKYNSEESFDDAKKCSENLGVKLDEIAIQNIFDEMLKSLKSQFEDREVNVAEENLQSRIRGNLLMALSNKFGHLLLSTGNKSEMATGYATIYGDMCGAFNPIKDLYKSEIFKLANWRNKKAPKISALEKINVIPQNIITKEPSAELRPNQKDSDSLPKYEILDQILFNLIEEEKSVAQIIDLGFEAELVKKVAKLFYSNEYKRRQSVIGPKLSKMSFDRDRRYPITNKFWS